MRTVLPLLLLIALAASADAGAGKISPVQMPKGVSVEATTLADVDGDGGLDLVVATGRRADDFRRTLRIYRRRAGRVDLTTLTGPGFGYRLDEIQRELPEPVVETG